MKITELIKEKSIKILNSILELEMSGVIRYTHYSFMIKGHNRIPIVKWMQTQAQESLDHATQAGEMITHFKGHPTLKIADLQETYHHNIDDILKESLEHERKSLELYYELLEITTGNSVLLEEYARKLIVEEEGHIGEVEKMLKAGN